MEFDWSLGALADGLRLYHHEAQVLWALSPSI